MNSLQAEKIDLTAIAPLVDATLDTLDEATLPIPNWVLELLDDLDSQDVVSSFSIFDPKKVPAADFSNLLHYGEDSVDLLLAHYGAEQPADTYEYTKKALISPDIRTEWKTFRSYLLKQPKGLYSQLTKLTTNKTLITMFPNISTLANICLSIPVGTASVERSFSQMKLIKTRLRN